MERLEMWEIPVTIRYNKVGVNNDGEEENYFGDIKINNANFDFNLALPYSVEYLDTIEYWKTRNFADSVELTLMDKKNDEIDLSFQEFVIFYSLFTISLKAALNHFEDMHYCSINFKFALPTKLINFLNEPKFNCKISNL